MRVRALTFNLGKASKVTAKAWTQLLDDPSWGDLLVHATKTVLVVSTQEDARNVPFLTALRAKLEGTHMTTINVSKSALQFNIGVLLAVPKSMSRTDSKQHIVNHDESLLRHLNKKASLIVDSIIDGIRFTVVTSHLPFVPKDEPNMGYSRREAAAKKIMRYLRVDADHPHVVLWTGDMNFRIVDGKDQLSMLMQNDYMTNFKIVPSQSGPTCKKIADAPPSCIGQYTGHTPPSNECYDPKRTVSYCDRVLYAAYGATVRAPAAVALLAVGVNASDHVPILTKMCVCRVRNSSLITPSSS